ncbi:MULTISPECIES: metal ABC transporter ATP-binding protein [unclassified Arthrobacter]|uniref:metal ABC transporter ATP-binding protein n=1 Tax=unclassified Arthrobacter TaxID=235627 RepID=UPI001492CB73|nr:MULTISPECIES: metal ABC transporter ATP-binding protein [unclassified Arthrobacter]MBE0008630.1 metal ABC transporter ATP-binding protein [Arthrobacter sp. AET 35A]NOJ62463.1 metal ABC transporter ATP-binding protein [Arthrobacter sp. 147(2020)]
MSWYAPTHPAPAPGDHDRVAALSVSGLSVSYNEVRALIDVDLTVERARICGLIGVNGSGKSTLFKCLMGLVQPSVGTVALFGKDHRTARRTNLVAYVPQSEDVDWTFPLSVQDVVLMGRYGRMGPSRRASRADRDAVDEALDRVGLTAQRGRQIGELSGGQKKRAFVARSIAQDAQLLLLDEPFAGVDKSSEATLISLLQELRDEGRTALISTHDLAGIPELCDEAVLLHNRVLAHGPPAEVLTHEKLALAFGPLPAAGPDPRRPSPAAEQNQEQ